MDTNWNSESIWVAFVCPMLALFLAVPLSRAAYWLPRTLDASLPCVPPRVHYRYRGIFWAIAPVLALLCTAHFGTTLLSAAALVYIMVLLTLAWIDAETGYLPDALTLPLLWMGLLVNLTAQFSPLADAVIGAAAAYASLWLLCRAFAQLTGRQGMGYGDFKMLAALGAWLGWAPLPWILLAASLAALVVATGRQIANRACDGAFSFGPYLAAAGIVAIFYL